MHVSQPAGLNEPDSQRDVLIKPTPPIRLCNRQIN